MSGIDVTILTDGPKRGAVGWIGRHPDRQQRISFPNRIVR
jgi:hypothetical protein